MDNPQCPLSLMPNIQVVLSQLKAQLQYPWIVMPQEDGIDILLLSRDGVKSVQRRVFFSFTGTTHISVHRKPISGSILESILQSEQQVVGLEGIQPIAFVHKMVTVVKRLQSYEVCVGVNDSKFKHLWHRDASGEKDRNPYGELRYTETFRPYTCHILVSPDGYLRQRCVVCTKVKARFAMSFQRQKTGGLSISTPNKHLDRSQLLTKVVMQQKKLKHSRTKLDRLEAALQKTLCNLNVNIKKQVSEELIKICLDYTTSM